MKETTITFSKSEGEMPFRRQDLKISLEVYN